MKEHDSENRVTYRPHDNISRPDKAKSRKDYIGLPKDAKMNEDSETRKIFVKYDISKPERIRQANTNLALPDGQFEQNTAHRETYQSHGISRFERVRAANDKIGLPEGQFEQNTANRETYQSHEIPRFERVRAANDKIGLPDGQFEQNTAHREIYQPHDVSRIERVRRTDDKIGLPEGQFDQNTAHREIYHPHDVPRFERIRATNDSSISKGEESRLDGKSEMHEKYSAKYGRRSEKAKPKGHLSVERSKSMSSLNSITSHDYRGGFLSQKPEKVR